MNQDEEDAVDEGRRRFLITATSVLSGVGVLCALKPFISSWMPSAAAKAGGAPIEVDLSHMVPGEQLTVEWRGRPVWIIKRTQEMLAHLGDHDNDLRDPLSLVDQQPPYAKNKYRSINPDYLIIVGVCTHLGCTPKYKPTINEMGPQWPGGFYCPCHGSRFDLAGRVFKGVPAPINLEVPPYRFISKNKVIIGEDEEKGRA